MKSEKDIIREWFGTSDTNLQIVPDLHKKGIFVCYKGERIGLISWRKIKSGHEAFRHELELIKREIFKMKRYLFICAFAQSRSKYFAERAMREGHMAMFAGFDEEADFPITINHVKWADKIVVLEENLFKNPFYEDLFTYWGKEYQTFHIEDEPQHFEEMYEKWKKLN